MITEFIANNTLIKKRSADVTLETLVIASELLEDILLYIIYI